jgi:hypothetical protein
MRAYEADSEGKDRFGGGSLREDSQEGSTPQAICTGDRAFVTQAARWLISTKGKPTPPEPSLSLSLSISLLFALSLILFGYSPGVWAKGLFCEAGLSHEVAAIRKQVASGMWRASFSSLSSSSRRRFHSRRDRHFAYVSALSSRGPQNVRP